MVQRINVFLRGLFLICCVVVLRSETVHSNFVSGYIEQTYPTTVILIEELEEELILVNNELPPGSEVGMWIDLQVTKTGFVIAQINENKTYAMQNRTIKLQRKLKNLDNTNN